MLLTQRLVRVTVYANSISCFDNLLRKLYELHYRAGVINYRAM